MCASNDYLTTLVILRKTEHSTNNVDGNKNASEIEIVLAGFWTHGVLYEVSHKAEYSA